MTCNDYASAIQELVDGTLDEAGRRRVDAHLSGCPACRALADDLRAIRRTAGSLGPMTPPPAAWTRLSQRLREPEPGAWRSARRLGGTRWLAVAATLVVAAGVTALWLRPRPAPPSPAPAPVADTTAAASGNASPEVLVQSVEGELKMAQQHYETALANLERMAASGDMRVDPKVAPTLRQNVALVDKAIADSRAALQTDPQNEPARESLFEALRRKVVLLQDTIALVNEMRKGNQAGAAAIVDGAKKS